MRVLVTGGNGQLGSEVVKQLKEKGFIVLGFEKKELDITNLSQVNDVLSTVKPDTVIHTAAYTQVDLAEIEEDQAFLINAIGTRNIAVISEKLGAKLVYLSTDYVFDGTLTEPIDEFQQTNPINIYGISKLAGENFVRDSHSKFFIVRTSWLYGGYGENFVKTMLSLAAEKKELVVVADQIGSPTYTVDLAERILDLIQTEKYGVYHISNSGKCSWFEFARAIFEEAGIRIDISPCFTKDFSRLAKRPEYSVFDHKSLKLNDFPTMRNWRLALREFILKNV